MSLFGRLFGKAQRYAQRNPRKVQDLTDKAARFADKRTKGRYRRQINQAVRKVDGMTGYGRSPDPRRDNWPDDPRYRDRY